MIGLALLAAASAGAPNLTICPDRPAKANGACTVPARHWQVEMSAIDWARRDADGERTDVSSIGQTLVKLGLTDDSDVELGWNSYVRVTSRPAAAQHASGVGDLIVRYKHRLTGVAAPVQAALIPFAKLPTADHDIGNGKIEGGIAVPVAIAVRRATVMFGPELDLLADADGHGYHAALTHLVNLAVSPTARLTLSGELWSNFNLDPSGTARQASADAAAAWLANKRVQLDAGANFGLTHATADVELYGGASILF